MSQAEMETRGQPPKLNMVKSQSNKSTNCAKALQHSRQPQNITEKSNMDNLSQQSDSRTGRVIIVSLSSKPLEKTRYFLAR